jgi:hypothetical protein
MHIKEGTRYCMFVMKIEIDDSKLIETIVKEVVEEN